MITVLIVLVLAAGLLALSHVYFRRAWHEHGNVQSLFEVKKVSLINLIATPESYHGKWVRVEGVCNFEFEGNALYLTKDDLRHCICKNAVWLEPDMEALNLSDGTLALKFNGRFVLVEGVFDKNHHGHMGLFSGAIKNVTRIMTCMRR